MTVSPLAYREINGLEEQVQYSEFHRGMVIAKIEEEHECWDSITLEEYYFNVCKYARKNKFTVSVDSECFGEIIDPNGEKTIVPSGIDMFSTMGEIGEVLVKRVNNLI